MQKMKESYSVFTSKGNGTFEVEDDSVKMSGWKNMSIKKTHVLEFNQAATLPLNKVSAEMKYFDMFGNTETLQFAMREADFRALKHALGK
ncbi:MAG: hypothetical protein V1835_01410 [Candidatus Micrarchaeota archaeon]